MKQITIRGIPADVQKAVKQEASRRKTSLNKALVSLLERGAGKTPAEKKTTVQYHDLDHFAGLWAKEEAAEFDRALDAQRRIDEGLWKRTK